MSDDLLQRLPPHSREAERAVIGGILRDPEVLADVQTLLTAGNFYFDAHQKFFAAIVDMAASGKPIDIVALHEELKQRQQLADVGGPEYLAELWDTVPSGLNAVHHAKIIRDKALARGLIHAANEILREAQDPHCPADELVGQAERRIASLADSLVPVGNEVKSAHELMRDAIARIDQRHDSDAEFDGLATGFIDLDAVLNGLRPGQLIVIAARPGGGKTALGLNIAANVAESGSPSLFFSLEQPEREISDRLLAMDSGVSLHTFRKAKKLMDDDVSRLTRAASPDGIGGAPLYLDDTSDQTTTRIAAVTRRAIRRHKVKLAVVDYLQLMMPENPRDSRVLQVGTAARRLKQLARNCSIPVICCCQVNRQVDNRSDGRPRLSDLRESGEIEQEADVVLFLCPPDDHKPAEQLRAVNVIVAKQRQGPTGDLMLTYLASVMRFENHCADLVDPVNVKW